MVTSDPLSVLYDGDCGVCTHTARFLRQFDTSHRLRLVALQTATFPQMPPLDDLMTQLHVRDARGRWFKGGAAWVEVSRRVPLISPLSLYAKLPLAMPVLDRAFRTIAENRHTISRMLGFKACKVPQDRDAI